MPTNAESVESEVFSKISQMLGTKSLTVTFDTPLTGDQGILDSMTLVELCLTLEDKAASIGFEFDWITGAGSTSAKSMFITAGSLVEEFIRQMESKK